MSCTLSHECRVMLSSLLTASTDATRVWLRAEMDRTVDPMLHSIFNRLKTKLTNGLERTQSGSDGDCAQVVNPCLHDQSANVQIHQLYSIIQSQPMSIKEEIEPMPTCQVQSFSHAPVSNEQSNHNLTDQHLNNNDDDETSQINLPYTEMIPRPNKFVQIKHNQFDDEECYFEECVDGGIEVKVEDEKHEDDQVDEESSRPVKRPRMDTTQPNNSIGKEIVTEPTTNPVQPNLAKPNSQFQCSHCPKSFNRKSTLQTHLRVHTGERPFECDNCGKRFNQNSSFKRHQLVHQNIKRFQCSECEKQFTLKHNLDSHLLIHSGERPFACRHCEKSFGKLCNRNRHEQAIHLHVKPYRCKQCAHTATEQSALIGHIRVVHFVLPPTIKQQRTLNIVEDRDPGELVEKV